MADIKALAKKPAVWIAVAGAGGIGFFLYERKKAKTTATTTDSTTGTDATATDPNAVDTGAQYDTSGYIPDGYGYGYDSGGGGGFYSAGVSSPYQVSSAAPQPTAATTNAEWDQAAVSALTAQGYNGMAVSAALGAYLAGASLTADQVRIVQAAIGAEGYPPVAGANGYPPQIKSQNSGQPGQTSNITVPNVVGKRADVAFAELRAHNLTPAPGGIAAANIVTSTNPPAGAHVAPKSKITVTAPKKSVIKKGIA